MTRDLRSAITALSKLVALLFLGRALASAAPLSVSSAALEEPLRLYIRNTALVSAVANALCFCVFGLFAARIARLLAPEDTIPVNQSANDTATVGIRLIAVAFLAGGLVSTATLSVGWYLQTLSPSVDAIWYPSAESGAGVIRGLASAAVGVTLFVTARRISRLVVRRETTAG